MRYRFWKYFSGLILVLSSVLLNSCKNPSEIESPLLKNQSQSISTTSTSPNNPTPNSKISAPPAITEVSWDSNKHFINIKLDTWPEEYFNIRMVVDDIEIPTEGAAGNVVVRPNAPLEQPPSGFIVGTIPWVTGLDKVDFPCCGSLRISFEGIGETPTVDYNLTDFGCSTASNKVCVSDWTVHEGDWIIEGSKTETIENTKFLQKGNIYIRDSATLILKNSELAMERGNTPTIHVYIFVDPNASLIVENSRIYPGADNAGLTCVFNHGYTSMTNSPTSIHYFDMSRGATLIMNNSSMIFEIGGLLQVTGGKTNISNSELGALALDVPAGAHLNAAGLHSGVFFEDWKVQDLIPEADYELTLDKVSVLKDELKGEYKYGPYERGWIFFLDQNAHVRLSDSELRKVFLDIRNDTAEFKGLRIGKPSSLSYRDIILSNITAMGEWPFTITDADVTITDSDYLFLQPSGKSTLRLIDSHIVEFIPRNFTGVVEFENGSWSVAGEIIGDVAYHSQSNNFTIKGSLKIADNLRENLQWSNAQVTRYFDVMLFDSKGSPLIGGKIKFNDKEYDTDENGWAQFPVLFDETNFKKPQRVEALYFGTVFDADAIDFFSTSPIQMHQ